MLIGYIGLGKMGYNMVLNLLDHKHKVVVYNRSAKPIKKISKAGAIPSFSIEEFIKNLPKQKIIWLMVPAGKPVNETIIKLFPYLSKGDTLIDGGNSFYKDSQKWAYKLAKYKINFVDAGVSGGPKGARHGACLMVGGKKKVYKKLRPLLESIAVPKGLEFFNGCGAGHFVKMVHNGIEYGMMQAIAEGFATLKKSDYNINLKKVSEVYSHGSVIESRLVSWLNQAFKEHGNDLKKASGKAGLGGQDMKKSAGLWMVQTAKELKIPIKVIEDSVKARLLTQKNPSFEGRIINALRNQFGGHKLN